MTKIPQRLAVVILCLTTFYACKKEPNYQGAGSPKAGIKKIMSLTGVTPPSLPTLENGILAFKSPQHFEAYITFLDAVTDPQNYDSTRVDDNGDTLEFDRDEILGTIEADLGFTSIRKITHDNFMQLNKIGWDKLEDIPEEHFIQDAAIKSTLNKDLIVRIGDNYVRCINKTLSVRVDASQARLFDAFSKLPETATLNDVFLIDPVQQYSTVFDLAGSGNVSVFGKKGNTLGYGNLGIFHLKHDAPDCNYPRKIVFSYLDLWQVAWGGLEASFDVDFGDGSPHQSFTSHYTQPGYTYAYIPNFTHTYAQGGNYVVKIHAVANAVGPGANATTANLDYPITVLDNNCKIAYKNTEREFHSVPDGSRAWSGQIFVTYETPWFFWDKMRVHASTASWLRDGNKWKASKSEIWHQLHTDRRDENNCNVLGQVDGDGWSSSSKEISTHRTDDPYAWNKISTQHGIKYHNAWYYFSKSLSICD